MAIPDYSTSASLNVAISGVNIAEGCPAANANDAIRQLMADAKGDARLCIYLENLRQSGDTDLQLWTRGITALLALGGGGKLLAGKGLLYDWGSVSTSTSLLSMLGLRNVVIDGNGSTIQINTTANVTPNVFYMYNYRGVVFANLSFTDTGYLAQRALAHLAGGRFIVIDNDGSSLNQDVTFDNCSTKEALAFITIEGDVPTNRTKGMWIKPNCRTETTFYSLNGQNSGDNIRGGFTAVNSARAYFSYGCSNHDLDIRVYHDGIAEGAQSLCLIKRYTVDTSNIHLRLTVSGSLIKHAYLATCEHSNTSGAASIIRDVDVEIHVLPGTTDTLPSRRLHFSAWDSDGGSAQTGPQAYVSTNIRLSGDLGQSTVPHVKADYTATSSCFLDMSGAISGYSLVQTVDAPGFVVRTGPDTYVLEKYGDLTSGVISIPMAALDATVALFEIDIAAEKTSVAATSGASTKMHRFCDTVGVESQSNTVAILTGTPIAAIPATAFNSSNLTRAYAGNGSALEITLAGSDYAVSTAFARVTVRALTRRLFR